LIEKFQGKHHGAFGSSQTIQNIVYRRHAISRKNPMSVGQFLSGGFGRIVIHMKDMDAL